MTVVIVLAGGSGLRMGEAKPKQFLEIDGKPILVYTLESLQAHAGVDAIEVVCLDGWQDTIRSYADMYGLSKLRYITAGGATCQESIRNGVYALESVCSPEDTVVVHDGVRPILDEATLTDVLAVCREHGNAVTSMPYNEQIFVADDDYSTTQYIPREKLRRVSTPQAYRYDLLLSAYRQAFAEEVGIYGSSYTNTMMVELGHRLYFAKGSDRNIKLTTKDDLALFTAYLNIKNRGLNNESL